MGQNTIFNHWINTDFNLLEQYKMALVTGSGVISWEKGAFDLKLVVGIMDCTPEPKGEKE